MCSMGWGLVQGLIARPQDAPLAPLLLDPTLHLILLICDAKFVTEAVVIGRYYHPQVGNPPIMPIPLVVVLL